MKRLALLFAVLLCCSTASNSDTPKRPRILGIASVRILVKDLPNSRAFYSKTLSEDHPCVWCGEKSRNTFSVNDTQYVQLALSPAPSPADLIDEITFITDDVPALRQYLASCNIVTQSFTPGIDDEPGLRALVDQYKRPPAKSPVSDVYLTALDPDGHRIGFVQLPPQVLKTAQGSRSIQLIHAGFIVKDRAAQDHFYKVILGFRPYWHGGMKDDRDDWVSLQVPDGTDWIEYMLNIPSDASKKLLGIMNHIAIGVQDVAQSAYALRKKGLSIEEEPQIGRDGKWQLNLYDPDLTRVEFMEFTPVQKPCCSEFTGPHPGPQPPPKAPAKP